MVWQMGFVLEIKGDSVRLGSGVNPEVCITYKNRVMHDSVQMMRRYPSSYFHQDQNPSASKDLSLSDRPASYQLVGEVTAHQGYDG